MASNKMQIEEKKKDTNKRTSVLMFLLVAIIFLCVGIGIGFAAGKNKYGTNCDDAVVQSKDGRKEEDRYAKHKVIMDQMKAATIKENLRYLTNLPHAPGSEQNKKLAMDFITQWKEHGFDKTESFKYNRK